MFATAQAPLKLYNRYALKIVGASGQGINTLGEIIAKSLKRTGFSVFAYREYPSLIKGGHATYQIDFSENLVSSSTNTIDCVVILNKQKTQWHLEELKPGGIIIHDIDNPRINETEAQLIREKKLNLVYIPALKLAVGLGGNEVVSNIVSLGFIWQLLSLDFSTIEAVVRETFASKPKYIELDVNCLRAGFEFSPGDLPPYTKRLATKGEIADDEKSNLHSTNTDGLKNYFSLAPKPGYQQALLISGNEALGLGAINAGVRIHYAYPMTPSSSILDYLAEQAHATGMIVKQAEDEITAAAMAIGSMHAGTRALTATSGGGFDLMTEHLSLAAMLEVPFVCVIAQRPGPATGLPTWTAQGDLLLSIFSGHGEYPRCVVAVNNPEDAFYTIQEAFNLAEKYQIPVLVLTDKLIAETNYTIPVFDQNRIPIERGLVPASDLAQLQATDRYALTNSGVSKRWLPGDTAADYNANSDEHDEEGNVTEEADMSRLMMDKRLRKESSLLADIPQPTLHFNSTDLAKAKKKIRLIGWGSVSGVIADLMHYYGKIDVKVDYLEVKYLWPLQAEAIKDYLEQDSPAILIENNATAQLAKLIRMETGVQIKHRILKYDGRPFFFEELLEQIERITA